MEQPKTILITGANKGIGFQIAKELGAKGHYIILASRSAERGQQALDELNEMGVGGTLLQMDVSKPQSIQKAYQQISASVSKLDVLINNAGILVDESYQLLDVPAEIFVQTIQTNSLGAFWVTQTFMPLLGSGSRVIMMSSGAGGFCKGLTTWAPVYSISKTTMNAITRQLHAVLKSKGIIINAMCPGWVRTDMGGTSASRSIEKGAETAVWLATDAPDSVNGQFLRDQTVIDW